MAATRKSNTDAHLHEHNTRDLRIYNKGVTIGAFLYSPAVHIMNPESRFRITAVNRINNKIEVYIL